MIYFNIREGKIKFVKKIIYRQLRARRGLLQIKDHPLRTRRALCTAIAPFWFSTEHL